MKEITIYLETLASNSKTMALDYNTIIMRLLLLPQHVTRHVVNRFVIEIIPVPMQTTLAALIITKISWRQSTSNRHLLPSPQAQFHANDK